MLGVGQQSATLVTTLRQTGIDVLGGLSDRLAQLRDLLAAVSGTFFALANLGAGQVDGLDFKQIAELLLSICDQLDGWGSEAVNTDALEQLARSGYALRSLEQQVKQFRLIASLTAIRVAESGTDGMNDFVDEIRAVPEMIQGSVHKVQDAVKGLTRGQAAAQTTSAQAATTLRQSQAHLAEAMAPLETLRPAMTAAKTRIRDGATRFAGEAHGETSELINAFQFSDFWAQRLQHIEAMLLQADALGTPVFAIAAAQLKGLADDGHQVVTQLRNVFARLNGLADRAGQVFQREGTIAKDTLAVLRDALARIMQAHTAARPVIQRSTDTVIDMVAQARAAEASLLSLLELSLVIDLAAVNARVKTSRVGDAQAAFNVLSTSVMETARLCRNRIDDCKAAVTIISQMHGDESAQRMLATTIELESALADCAQALSNIESADANLAASCQEVANLVMAQTKLLGQCGPGLAQFATLLGDVSALSASLAKRHHGNLENSAALQSIYDSYSMRREREIHNALLGEPIAAAEEIAPATLDDVLF